MLWVKESICDVLHRLDTCRTRGLSLQEVERRLSRYGLNEFDEGKKETLFAKILHHLREIPTMILIVAASIAAYMAIFQGQATSWPKVIVIMSIVVINVVLGIYQESKAEKALESLKKMNAFKTKVIREGTKQIIDANQLVPGDIVELTAGDVITADARLIEASSLQVEEAALTGESQPVEKDPDAVFDEKAPLGDRLNMVYSGCLVTGGRALAVVVETAMGTEMGKIAGLLNTTEKLKTPLQLRLTQLAKRISVTALGAGSLMFLLGRFVFDNEAIDMLFSAVALGVAAVPETLPIIVTMILAHGVYNMVTKHTIIRKIPAVETVGNTSVICSDKTGTLTQNKMKIQRVWHVGHENPTAAEDRFHKDEVYLIELLASCSNATIEVRPDGNDEEAEHVVGDPTEIAIIRMLHDLGLTRVDAERQYPRVHELPFDSGRKLMTTVHHVDDGYLVVTKGAFDRIPIDWDVDMRKRATEIHDDFARQALRVIAVGCKVFAEKPGDLSIEALEKDLKFIGMVGMIDPPRSESAMAVAQAREAGIRTVMITGDHVVTAAAIAREIGIMCEGDRAVTGAELGTMSDEELHEQVRGISVYARVSPEDKIRIVQAWTAHGEVVAMTGDGVNDAPALKAADVGVAMGITGTEVSKNAADMVITDDNFATIVDAIGEGRKSFDNIRKTVCFLLSVNFAEIFILLSGMAVSFFLLRGQAGAGLPVITALQILLINVVSDGIPGFFLAFEPAEAGVMRRKPLGKNAGIFAGGLGGRIAMRSVTFSILTLGAYTIGSRVPLANGFDPGHTVGVTMAFAVLSWASVLNIFTIRSSDSIFKTGLLSNKGVFFAALSTMAFTAVVLLVPPLAQVFNARHDLPWQYWLVMFGIALMQVVIMEVLKLIGRIRTGMGTRVAVA
ncbi:MAG: cation-translocating P-type ATPase [Treponema sp.]|nr:cation-translocating P-type ATPase [Treponema sp.]